MKKVYFAGLLILVVSHQAMALETSANLGVDFNYSLSRYGASNEDSDLATKNNASKFHIGASAEDGDVRAILYYERDASNDGSNAEGVREFYAGLEKTQYGQLLFGRKSSDYKLAGAALDPFGDTSVAGIDGKFSNVGASYGLSNLTNGSTPNTIAYRSPDRAGFTANIDTYIDDRTGGQEKHDYGGGIHYAFEGQNAGAGIQYLRLNGAEVAGAPGTGSAYRVHASWAYAPYKLGASYEILNLDEITTSEKYIFIAGSYVLCSGTTLAVSFGNTSGTPFDGNGITVGAFHEIFPRLSLYLAGRNVWLESGDKTNTIATGIRFSFEADIPVPLSK